MSHELTQAERMEIEHEAASTVVELHGIDTTVVGSDYVWGELADAGKERYRELGTALERLRGGDVLDDSDKPHEVLHPAVVNLAAARGVPADKATEYVREAQLLY